MSDMVQQPVIQLVQELTMTAVVEQHDCTDTKKEDKSRKKSPRPSLNTNNAFVVYSLPGRNHFGSLPYHHRGVSVPQSHTLNTVVFPKFKWFWGTQGCLSKNWGGKSTPPLPSLPRLYHHLSGRWQKRELRIQTGPTQLVTLPFVKLFSDTSEICWHWKVIIYIYKEPEVLQTDTCFE